MNKREIHKKPHVLFITKKRHSYGHGEYHEMLSGLYNSVKFISDMLNKEGFESKHVDVVDGNDIDREVFGYKPTHVFIEALWATPEKMKEVAKLHPDVKWYIRLHSELPFIALEGIAMEWLFDYVKIPSVFITANSKRIGSEIESLLHTKVEYLPNYYPIETEHSFWWWKKKKHEKHTLDIGCFGAIRQLKNQFAQAVAAVQFADRLGKKLRFHINVERQEGSYAQTVLKNIRFLFKNLPQHELIEHDWLPREEFIELMKTMDISMQVTFSETYNIVTADAVANHIPVVVSSEVRWVSDRYKVSPTSVEDIVDCLKLALTDGAHGSHSVNFYLLRRFNRKSIAAWTEFLRNS